MPTLPINCSNCKHFAYKQVLDKGVCTSSGSLITIIEREFFHYLCAFHEIKKDKKSKNVKK